MGVYDLYEGVQLKVGPCELKSFKVGDTVPILDGVYVGYEGIVVISGCIFVARFANLETKWGEVLDPRALLNGKNPVIRAMIKMAEGENG